MSRIYIIHENDDWTAPLRVELNRRELPFEEWFLDRGTIDLSSAPPDGVFYNRMSASSHTRGHRFAAEYTAAVLAWLERHERVVVNDSRAMQLEISKAAQYAALNSYGIRTPKTIAAIGRREILEAARGFERPFITKHNRGGKGLGVRLFKTHGSAQELRGKRRVRRAARRDHADPEIYRSARRLHHALRVRGREVSIRRPCRHVPRFRALPRGRMPIGRRALPQRP